MKRLLAYLFVVLGLGLVFSVNANANIYDKNLIAPNSNLYFIKKYTIANYDKLEPYIRFSSQIIKNGKLIKNYKFDKSQNLFKLYEDEYNSHNIRISKKLFIELLNKKIGNFHNPVIVRETLEDLSLIHI